ncbi:MAG: TRAP transporter large permease subunit [Burkholderiales bacterium]
MRESELDCHAIIRSLDRFTDTTGKLVSAAILFMLIAINYVCFARYLIGKSTSWVAETSVMANGAAFMLGCGYALLRRAHVRTDLFWDRYSGRTKVAIDLVSYLLLFFPVMLAILWIGIGLMKQDDFVAVPMFILMGYLCAHSGVVDRMFHAFRRLFAPVPGALYLVVLLTATLFAIAAGTVSVRVALIGIVAGPMMIKAGYDAGMSAGAITAGGTLGILIPPSVMPVVMGPVIGVSVGKLYEAALGPGLLLAAMYVVYTMIRSFVNPRLGPPMPLEERPKSLGPVLMECLLGLLPLTVLTLFALGAILAGLTSTAEAAALGALGAILLAIVHERFTWNGLLKACDDTLATTSMVMFLAVTSNIFGSVFARLGTAGWINDALLSMGLPSTATMALVLCALFLLSWPFEWPAIVFIFVPVFVPVAMSAYYLKRVVSDWNVGTIARGMRQFLAIQCVAIALVLLFPAIVMWLPTTLERRPAGTAWDWMLDVWDANHLELIERGDEMTPDGPPGG